MQINWHKAFWLAVLANLLAAVVYDWARHRMLSRAEGRVWPD